MSDDHARLSALLPGYELSGEIGRGGWGVVYRAVHRTLDRPVAIKELPAAFSDDPSARDRFRSEARVVASLDHPHIVPLYDFVEEGPSAVFVMELMTGGTLWDRFSAGELSPEAACSITLALLAALNHAHGRGVLHRDTKPENVLFNAAGVPKLADFGIAKVLEDGAGTRTATGMIMGTPAYMAPEQGSGDPVGPATDLYAVGAMLYELLSGRLPFESTGNPLAQLYRHVHEPPTPLHEVAPSVPAELSGVVMWALAKDPADRPATAASFAGALNAAATRAYGADWPTRSGVPVLATRAMLASADTLPATRPEPPPPPPPPRAPGTSRRGRIIGLAAAVAVLAGLGIGVALLGGDAGDADDPPDAAAEAPTDPALEPPPTEVPPEAEERFEQACLANDVDPALCACALERALDQLSVEQFLANDELLQDTGDRLTGPVREQFDWCLAQEA